METTGERNDLARTPAQDFGMVLLGALVLAVGGFTALFGPLFAVACGECQDGVRPAPYAEFMLFLAHVCAPLVVAAALVGMAHPRGGAKAGGTGLAALAVLFALMLGAARAGG